MKQLGYSLLSVLGGTEAAFCSRLPYRFNIPDVIRVDMDTVGMETADGAYRLVERWRDDTLLAGTVKTGEAIAFDGTKIVISLTTRPMTAQEISDRDAQTAQEIADREAQAAIDLTDTTEHAIVTADGFIQNFISMSPTGIEAYIEANTNNIADVRALLKKMGKMLLLIARSEYRE